jgi:hypothetical protein
MCSEKGFRFCSGMTLRGARCPKDFFYVIGVIYNLKEYYSF